jgi:hypothetical protein
MKVIIDRFEGDFAVCEKHDRTMVTIRRDKLPTGAKEGDVLIIEGDSIRIDVTETEKRKKRADDLMKGLWENNRES